jgi:replicative DNA helicase
MRLNTMPKNRMEEIFMNNVSACDLRTLVGGFKNGESIVIGARPSLGKTTLGLGIISSLIAGRHVKTAFISLEMDKSGLQKLLSKYGSEIDASSMIVNDKPNISLSELLAMIKDLADKDKVNVFCIDYLGLVQGIDDSNIYQELRKLAGELNVIIISLSQLPRTAEDEKPEVKQLGTDVVKYADKIYLLNGSNVQEGKILTIDVIEAKNGNDFCDSSFVLKLS